MAWLESHQSLARHPKTLRLMRRLDTSRAATIGHLHLFWWWCLDYAPDGDLAQFDNEEIAIALEWDGDADALVIAMIDAGFIDADRHVHDWNDYGGKLLKRKEINRNRMRDARASHEPRTEHAQTPANNDGATHVHRTDDARATHVQSQSTEQNRREENTFTADGGGDAEADDDGGGVTYPAEFLEFWSAYPKKTGKGAALKRWKQIKPSKTTREKILAAIDAQRHGRQWQQGYIMDPARWLNERHWEDEVASNPIGTMTVLDAKPKPPAKPKTDAERIVEMRLEERSRWIRERERATLDSIRDYYTRQIAEIDAELATYGHVVTEVA
jgi:hypothetical protein